MYMINKIRPNAIPWGTIDVTGTVLGGIPFTTTVCVRSDRKSWIQLSKTSTRQLQQHDGRQIGKWPSIQINAPNSAPPPKAFRHNYILHNHNRES
jgi:hypothetical protein